MIRNCVESTNESILLYSVSCTIYLCNNGSWNIITRNNKTVMTVNITESVVIFLATKNAVKAIAIRKNRITG